MNGESGLKERIMDIGERKVTELVNQVLSAKGCAWAREGSMESVRKGIEELFLSFIAALDIPTRKDLNELNNRLEMLNGKVVSLSLKVDKMLEAENKKRSARKRVPKKSAEGHTEEQ